MNKPSNNQGISIKDVGEELDVAISRVKIKNN